MYTIEHCQCLLNSISLKSKSILISQRCNEVRFYDIHVFKIVSSTLAQHYPTSVSIFVLLSIQIYKELGIYPLVVARNVNKINYKLLCGS